MLRGDPRRRSRGRSRGRGPSWDRFRRRTRSGHRRSSRRSQSRSPLRRRSRSRSRGRRRSRSNEKIDQFGRSKDIKHTKKFKSSDNRSSRSDNKPVSNNKVLPKLQNRLKSEIKSEPEPESEGPPVSKSIQSAILKNIIGDFGSNDDKVKEDSVDDVVSKIMSGNQDHLDKDDFESRMKKLKSQVTDKAKAGVYGKVQLDQESAITTSKQKTDEQNNDKELEDEAARLRKELLEMKQKIEEKKRKNRTPTPSSSSSSESESEVEEEEEGDSEDESESDSGDGSDESETDNSDRSDQEDGGPSVFDIFKSTVLQKEKSRKSTHLYDDSMRKSKLVQTKTSKILKERMELLKRNNKK